MRTGRSYTGGAIGSNTTGAGGRPQLPQRRESTADERRRHNRCPPTVSSPSFTCRRWHGRMAGAACRRSTSTPCSRCVGNARRGTSGTHPTEGPGPTPVGARSAQEIAAGTRLRRCGVWRPAGATGACPRPMSTTPRPCCGSAPRAIGSVNHSPSSRGARAGARRARQRASPPSVRCGTSLRPGAGSACRSEGWRGPLDGLLQLSPTPPRARRTNPVGGIPRSATGRGVTRPARRLRRAW